MAKNRPFNSDDSDLFRQAIGEVRPVHNDRVKPHHTRPKAQPLQREKDEQNALAELQTMAFDMHLDAAEHESGEELLFRRPGIQLRVFSKLRRGQYRVEASCDLHALNRETAQKTLERFILESQLADRRCVRVVHGKGLHSKKQEPVIKKMTAKRLARHPAVLAYASAPRHDGGTGAVYVLLKRYKPI